eukprot:scaffold106305_cov70-Phaeocystis_antarctica.AAC.4
MGAAAPALLGAAAPLLLLRTLSGKLFWTAPWDTIGAVGLASASGSGEASRRACCAARIFE